MYYISPNSYYIHRKFTLQSHIFLYTSNSLPVFGIIVHYAHLRYPIILIRRDNQLSVLVSPYKFHIVLWFGSSCNIKLYHLHSSQSEHCLSIFFYNGVIILSFVCEKTVWKGVKWIINSPHWLKLSLIIGYANHMVCPVALYPCQHTSIEYGFDVCGSVSVGVMLYIVLWHNLCMHACMPYMKLCVVLLCMYTCAWECVYVCVHIMYCVGMFWSYYVHFWLVSGRLFHLQIVVMELGVPTAQGPSHKSSLIHMAHLVTVNLHK